MWVWLAFFVAGVVVGGFMWGSLVKQHMEQDFKLRMRLAARYRDNGDTRHDTPRTGGGR
jgi:hypothetical protein